MIGRGVRSQIQPAAVLEPRVLFLMWVFVSRLKKFFTKISPEGS